MKPIMPTLKPVKENGIVMKSKNVLFQESVVRLQALFRGYLARKKLRETRLKVFNIFPLEIENIESEKAAHITSAKTNNLKLEAVLDLNHNRDSNYNPKRSANTLASDSKGILSPEQAVVSKPESAFSFAPEESPIKQKLENLNDEQNGVQATALEHIENYEFPNGTIYTGTTFSHLKRSMVEWNKTWIWCFDVA